MAHVLALYRDWNCKSVWELVRRTYDEVAEKMVNLPDEWAVVVRTEWLRGRMHDIERTTDLVGGLKPVSQVRV